jgi:hypothetical protein
MAGSPYVAVYSATDLNKSGGKVLDSAGQGAVQITRRSSRFVLMREEDLQRLLEAARRRQPHRLADLLRGYDAAKIKSLTRRFVSDPPSGRELL